jgi:hypothetical protein
MEIPESDETAALTGSEPIWFRCLLKNQRRVLKNQRERYELGCACTEA